MLKSLPAGNATFRHLISGDFLYVDKTKWIYQIVNHPRGVYFLSRPRRFGKSLMVSTLEEIFLGNRALFKGLWIDQSDYPWQKHPVIRIDFSKKPVEDVEGLKLNIKTYLQRIAEQHQVVLSEGRYYDQFDELIYKLSQRGQVVILIDEYDKPIIDHLTNVEEAKKIRDTLKGFYNVIKASDQYLRFVFLTGISKFSKVGVFSGLNNLTDLTMTPAFSAALGITEDELIRYFSDYIAPLAEQEELSHEETLAMIKKWYNGFCFSRHGERVYNPYSLLRLFQDKIFSNYWFETGTPTLLINLIKEKEYNIATLDNLNVTVLDFSTYEIDQLNVVPIFFQTGYLTIKHYNKERNEYQLYYPNYEVESAFLEYLLNHFTHPMLKPSNDYLWRLTDALKKKEFDEFFHILEVFLADIPYDMQLDYEKYYQTIFYLIIKLVGMRARAEERTNKGRIDTVIELDDAFVFFEFKLNGSAQEALEQIKSTDYTQKYQLAGKQLILVGVNFSTKTRSVSEWKIEKEGQEANQAPTKPAPPISSEPKQPQEPDNLPIIYDAVQIARNFLAQGLDAGLVAQSTGLPLDAVQALAKQVQRELGNRD